MLTQLRDEKYMCIVRFFEGFFFTFTFIQITYFVKIKQYMSSVSENQKVTSVYEKQKKLFQMITPYVFI